MLDMTMTTLAERWGKYVDRSAGPDACWPWTGARIPKGYGSLGRVEVNGVFKSQVGAHRVAFYLSHGHWPRVARHICDNPPCVNPAHILDGGNSENQRDAVERGRHFHVQKTHCPRGHPYNIENTRRDSSGHRRCKTCTGEHARRQAAKRMSEQPEHVRALARERQQRYMQRKRQAG